MNSESKPHPKDSIVESVFETKRYKPVDEHRLVALKCAFKDPAVHDCRRLAMNHPMGDRLVGLAEIFLTGR